MCYSILLRPKNLFLISPRRSKHKIATHFDQRSPTERKNSIFKIRQCQTGKNWFFTRSSNYSQLSEHQVQYRLINNHASKSSRDFGKSPSQGITVDKFLWIILNLIPQYGIVNTNLTRIFVFLSKITSYL